MPDLASPLWAPHVHVDRRPFLLARGRINDAIRHWFRDQGFVEADTAAPQGLDRLVMLATGAERIDQVLWSPVVG